MQTGCWNCSTAILSKFYFILMRLSHKWNSQCRGSCALSIYIYMYIYWQNFIRDLNGNAVCVWTFKCAQRERRSVVSGQKTRRWQFLAAAQFSCLSPSFFLLECIFRLINSQALVNILSALVCFVHHKMTALGSSSRLACRAPKSSFSYGNFPLFYDRSSRSFFAALAYSI